MERSRKDAPADAPQPKGGACPRCGSALTGRYCADCGAALAVSCSGCGAALPAGSRFCIECGQPVAAGATAAAPAGEPFLSGSALRWALPAIAFMMLVAFLIGQRIAGRGAPAAADASTAMGAPFAGGGGAMNAPDISSMSPEERAQRLFDRIMRYAGSNDLDSARFFAPMAVQSYEMLPARDAHWHYDVGMIALATADSAMARAEADTVLRGSPTHLLGLLLAMRATSDPAARTRFATRALAAAPAERKRPLVEYTDHANDLDAGLAEARRRAGKAP